MNSALLAQLAFVAASAAGVYSFVTTAKDAEQRRVCTAACALRPDYASDDRLAPDFELPTLDGTTKKLSDFRGKVVIMNFWTKTCRPCLEEMPALADLGSILKDFPDIELVTVTTDESPEDAKATLASILTKPAPFVTFVDSENEIVNEKYGTRLFPETWFIDKQGVIRARIDGARRWTDPLHLEFAQTLRDPLHCPIAFNRRKPSGPLSGLCDTLPIAQ